MHRAVRLESRVSGQCNDHEGEVYPGALLAKESGTCLIRETR